MNYHKKPILHVIHSVATFLVALTMILPVNLLWVVTANASTSERVVSVAPLNVPRVGHTATVLADGRVLVAGGENTGGILDSVEIFVPGNKAFVLAGNLTAARIGHSATLLNDGRVLIAGGHNATGPLDSAEIYDPATRTSQAIGPMTSARSGHTATRMLDGKVLIAGGDDAGTAELFDPATETFALVGNLAEPRTGQSATLFADNSVLLAGGGNDTAEYFDPTNLTFTLVPQAMTTPRTGQSAIATADNLVLLIGGDVNNSIESFDPTTDTFAVTATLSNTISTATLLANENILVLGPDAAGVFSPTGTNQWEALTDTNEVALLRTGHTATELPANKQILVAGGTDNSNQLVSVAALFNPAHLTTDRDDYAPYTFVDITGGGFLPGETITNQVVQIEGPAAGTAYDPWAVVADTNGNFTTTWLVFTEDLLNTTLELTAKGVTSDLTATTRFTDSAHISSVASSPTSRTVQTGQAATYSITSSWGGNGSDTAALSIINASPALPGGWVSFSRSTLDQNNTTSTLTITPTSTGTWTFEVQASGSAGTVTTTLLTLTVSAGTATKILVETAADGSGTVVPAQALCSGSAITVYAITRDAGNNFVANVAATWSLASKSGGVANGDLVASGNNKSATFTGNLAGTAVIDAASSSLPKTDSGTITVNALPSQTITAPSSVCANSSGNTASVVDPGSATFAWTISGGTIQGSTTGSSVSFTAGASGTVQLSCVITKGGCSTAGGQNQSVTINTLPSQTISAPSSVCPSSSGNTASVVDPGSATFAWTITGGTIPGSTTSSSVSFTAGASGTVHLSCVITKGGCSTAGGQNQSVTINTLPSQTITAPSSVCPNSSGNTASVVDPGSATFAWTISGGTIPGSTTGSSISFTAGASGTVQLSCVITKGGCSTAGGQNQSVTINTLPSQTITAPSSVCPNSSGNTASVVDPGSATFAWTITGGTIPGSTTGSSVSFTAGASGTVQLSCVITKGGCSTAGGQNQSVTINTLPSQTITAPASVCANSAGNTASVVDPGSATFAWTISGGTIPGSTTGSSVSFTAGASGTVQLSCVITKGGCSTAGGQNQSVTINAASVGGTASATSAEVCSGTGTTISLAGQTGSIVKWQSSPDNATWTDIASTANPYSTGNLTANTYFRAVVQSGVCGTANSAAALVTVDAVSVGGTASATSAEVCSGSGTTISLAGQTGSIVKWQSSPTGTTWTDIASTANPYSTGNLTANTYFRAVVQSGACSTANSAAALVTVDAVSVGGTASATAAHVCNGSGTTISLAGQTGSIVKWQSSPDNATWTDIASTANPYSTGNLTASTYFRAVVQSGACSTANSAAALVTVDAVSVGGTASATSAEVCSGSGTTISLAGQTGSIVKWQSSPTGTTWTDIASTANPYSTGNLTANTYFRAVVQSGACSTANSAAALVTVDATSVGGTASATAAHVCNGSGTTISLAGQTGSIVKWQSSPDNATWTDIAATANPYSTGNLTANTYFRAVVQSGACSTANSASALVTVDAASVGGTATPTTGTVCSGTGTAVTLSGYTGTIQWQSSTDNASFNNVNGATSATLNTGNLTQTTYYRAVVTSGVCGSANSSTATVTVNAAPPAPTAGSDSPVCAGATLHLTASTVAGATYSWTGPNGFTSSAQNPTIASATTAASGTYNVTATVNGCPSAAGTASVTVNAAPGSTITAPASVCGNSTGNTASVPDAGGGASYSWTISGGTITAGSGTRSITFTAGASGAVVLNCTVISSAGCSSGGSQKKNVTISTGPATPGTITQANPSGSAVCTGASGVTYTIAAVSGATTYTWTVPSGASITAGQGTTSITVNWGSANSGNVAVTAGNTCGASSPATLAVTVSTTPTVSQPADQTTCVGATVTFTVTATGGGLSYQWLLNGNPIHNGPTGNGSTYSGATTATLTISNAQTGDAVAHNKGFQCQVSNNCDTTTSATPKASLVVGAPPTAYTVTGGGSFCSGGSGVAVGLSDSDAGVSYQLQLNGVNAGSPVAGTGSAITFGNQTSGGTYTVVAIPDGTSCQGTMSGSVTVTVNPLPTAYAVTGGGTYCSGGSGVAVGLANSQTGKHYQLYRNGGATAVGSSVAGTGSALSFGSQTAADTYTVVATDDSTSCTANMTGSATVTAGVVPTTYAVTGGGAYCSGGSGVAVGLANSQTGKHYQLYRNGGATVVGSSVAGTGSAISFGSQIAADTYTVVATDDSTGCTANMTGSAVVTVNPVPTTSAISGNTSVCAGTAGVTYSVTATSGSSYAWTVPSGATITAGGSGPNNNQITVTFGSSSGNVTVQETNASGCLGTVQTQAVTVNTAPSVTTNPSNQTVLAGANASFTAAASGTPAPTVQWQVSIDGGSSWADISGATSTTFSFTTVAGDNNKQYRARFSNTCGSDVATTAATLTVNAALVVTSEPDNQTTVAGNATAFSATADGLPPVQVQWQVSTDGGTSYSDVAGATAPTLTFVAAGADHGKKFRAVFRNSVASVPSDPATLTVLARDVTASVKLTYSGATYNLLTKLYTQTVTVQNIGTGTFEGPLSVVLDSLSSNATLNNKTGATVLTTPAPSSYRNTNVGLSSGASTTVTLQFSNPSAQRIGYNTRVLVTTGQKGHFIWVGADTCLS